MARGLRVPLSGHRRTVLTIVAFVFATLIVVLASSINDVHAAELKPETSPVEVAGTLTLVPDETGHKPDQWLLHTDDDLLELKGVPDEAQPGTQVAITGSVTGNSVVQVEALVTDTRARAEAYSAPLDASDSGSRDVYVRASGVNLGAAPDIMRNVDDYYRTSTNGAIGFRLASISGFVRTSDSCSLTDLRAQALAGFSLPDDAHLAVWAPDCGTTEAMGKGELGGRVVWIFNGSEDVLIWAHELGHNLGLHHASVADCEGGPITDCPSSASQTSYGEYGGPDVMGSWRMLPLDPVHLQALGLWETESTQIMDNPPRERVEVEINDYSSSSSQRAVELTWGEAPVFLIYDNVQRGLLLVHGLADDRIRSITQEPFYLPKGASYTGDLGVYVRLKKIVDDTATIEVSSSPLTIDVPETVGCTSDLTNPARCIWPGAGAALDGYVIETRTAGSEWTEVRSVPAAHSRTSRLGSLVAELNASEITAGVRHELRVRAIRGEERGDPSPSTMVRVPGPPPAPPPPPDVRATPQGWTIDWSPIPDDGGYPMQGSGTLQMQPTSGGQIQTLYCTLGKFTCLAPGQPSAQARFRITASNEAGSVTSDWSDPVFPGFGPEPVTGIVATVSNGHAEALWQPALDNGHPVTSYSVQFMLGNPGRPPVATCSTATTSCETDFTDDANASSDFYVTVQAENQFGFATSPAGPFPIHRSGPRMTLDAVELRFPDTPERATSAPVTVRVGNTGDRPLVLEAGSVQVGGPDTDQFTKRSDTCSGTQVDPGGSCSVDVQFTPTSEGTKTAGLLFRQGDSYERIPLHGTATYVPSFVPRLNIASRLDFYDHNISQYLWLTNTGTSPLIIARDRTRITGSGAAHFLLSLAQCPTEALQPREGCPVWLTFMPRAAGSHRADLVLESNAPDGPAIVELTGRAVGNFDGPTTSPGDNPGGQNPTGPSPDREPDGARSYRVRRLRADVVRSRVVAKWRVDTRVPQYRVSLIGKSGDGKRIRESKTTGVMKASIKLRLRPGYKARLCVSPVGKSSLRKCIAVKARR